MNNHYVTVQQQSTQLDSAGQPVQSWTTFANLWVDIEPLIGANTREMALAKEMYAELSHRINSWFIPGITPAMRIQYGSRIFNILAVINIKEQNQKMQILCSERTG